VIVSDLRLDRRFDLSLGQGFVFQGILPRSWFPAFLIASLRCERALRGAIVLKA